jgi:hypothetical protein
MNTEQALALSRLSLYSKRCAPSSTLPGSDSMAGITRPRSNRGVRRVHAGGEFGVVEGGFATFHHPKLRSC